jgi:Family of unknown function (DUF5681)
MSDDYVVGYGKPPRHSQFKPGETGNPQGRPKGSKDLKTDLLEVLAETIRITEGGRERPITKQRALIMTLMARALKGNDRAAAKILDLYLRILVGDDLDDLAEKPPSQEEREVLEVLEARIRKKLSMQPKSSDGEAS